MSWEFRRHHPIDYVATGVFATGALIAEVVPERDEPRWSGPILLDTVFRDAFVLHDYDDRRIAMRFSDVTLAVLVTHRFIDTALVTWAGHGAADVAWQMAMIDVQALSFTLAITNATKRAFERERPSGLACRTEAGYDQRCRELGSDGSFYSGHTSLAFTAAGLTCVQHAHVPIYGGDGDVLACVTASFAAASIAFERVLGDRHYLSDIVLGSAVGVFSGAVMPYASFFAHRTSGDLPAAVSLAPAPTPYGGGLSLRGFF
jgi:membrane-associated phospholipid phosphatase